MKAQVIQDRIYEVRGEKIMLDFDLAQLYQVETKVFNQAVKRNLDLFPGDFMFQLTKVEFANLRSQNVTSRLSDDKTGWGGTRYMPYAFTEHGVAMLASILKSAKARKMNIAIVRAFIALKKIVAKNVTTISIIKELKERIDEHDIQLKSIYDALENMLDEKEEEKQQKIKWQQRERIGFKK